MRTTRNHYEILGVAQDAGIDEIRAKYKTLVRKYHPDVAKDKETAHKLFIQITDAYNTLSDPMKRKEYDAKLKPQTQPQAPYGAASTGSKYYPPPGPGQGAQTQGAPRGKKTAEEYLKAAQSSFIHRRLVEAMSFCQQAVSQAPDNPKAHIMMGDIFSAQGKKDKAIESYARALQLNPNSREADDKLTAIMGGRARDLGRSRMPAFNTSKMMLINVGGWSLGVFLIAMLGLNSGSPASPFTSIPMVSTWSWNVFLLVAASSFTIGVMLALNGVLGDMQDDLFATPMATKGAVPVGWVLTVGSLFFFIGAAVLYLIIGGMQKTMQRPVMIMLGCVLGIVVLASFFYSPEVDAMALGANAGASPGLQVFLFGGNTSFIAMLAGWAVGAQVQPKYA